MEGQIFKRISHELRKKIRVINGPDQFDAAHIQTGLIATHADWSGPSVGNGNAILRILDVSYNNDFEVLLLDINRVTAEEQVAYLGFHSHGYFEGIWKENGRIISTHRRNDSENESFHHFKATLKAFATNPRPGL